MGKSMEEVLQIAYDEWRDNSIISDNTARLLEECRRHTPSSEIDRFAEKYSVAFLDYVDIRMRNV